MIFENLIRCCRYGKAARALASAKKGHPARVLDTQWELLEIDKAGLMDKVDFYRWNRRLNQWGKL